MSKKIYRRLIWLDFFLQYNEKFIILISEQSIPVLNYAIEKVYLNIISVISVNPSIDVNI